MKFPKVLIALDRSALDQELIYYSHIIAKTFEVESALFFHVVPFYLPPNLLNSNLENLIRKDLLPANKQQRELTEDIQAVYDGLKGVAVNLLVVEGKPQTKLLKAIKEEQPDLLVLGKKQVSNGSGIIARRIARKAACAIWFVSEKANPEFRKILVPIDFSPHSLRALKTALHLKKQMTGVEVTALHLIEIPMTSYKAGRDKDEIIQGLRDSANDSFRKFLTKNHLSKTDLDFKIPGDEFFDVAQYIKDIALREKSDLIIIGAKGSSGLERFVFGSVTEKLISHQESFPILVIR